VQTGVTTNDVRLMHIITEKGFLCPKLLSHGINPVLSNIENQKGCSYLKHFVPDRTAMRSWVSMHILRECMVSFQQEIKKH